MGVSDLVGHPDDRVSRVAAQIIIAHKKTCYQAGRLRLTCGSSIFGKLGGGGGGFIYMYKSNENASIFGKLGGGDSFTCIRATKLRQ